MRTIRVRALIAAVGVTLSSPLTWSLCVILGALNFWVYIRPQLARRRLKHRRESALFHTQQEIISGTTPKEINHKAEENPSSALFVANKEGNNDSEEIQAWDQSAQVKRAESSGSASKPENSEEATL